MFGSRVTVPIGVETLSQLCPARSEAGHLCGGVWFRDATRSLLQKHVRRTCKQARGALSTQHQALQRTATEAHFSSQKCRIDLRSLTYLSMRGHALFKPGQQAIGCELQTTAMRRLAFQNFRTGEESRDPPPLVAVHVQTRTSVGCGTATSKAKAEPAGYSLKTRSQLGQHPQGLKLQQALQPKGSSIRYSEAHISHRAAGQPESIGFSQHTQNPS